MSTHARPPLELVLAPSPAIEYLSPKDAAKRLGVDVSTLYRQYSAAMRSGQIKTIKIGAARRILWDSLIAYIEAATQEAA